jgi:hypothetical protein
MKGIRPLGNTSTSRKRGYVSKGFKLPACRKDGYTNAHRINRGDSQERCMMCRYLQQRYKAQPDGIEAHMFKKGINGPKGRLRRSIYRCSYCTIGGQPVPLCREPAYHAR